MFYQEFNDPVLRFGDILRGYVATFPKIIEPKVDIYKPSCDIKVSYPEFVVIMSPCCSIKDGLICLAPLIQIDANIYRNAYLSEDLTRINRKMYPNQAYGQHKWDLLPEQKKQEEEIKGLSYAYLSYFVYAKHQILQKYKLTDEIETDCYMIDFRKVYSLECNKIIKPDKAPIETKCLQLSVETRTELRNKVVYFFGRIPEEDMGAD
jgi:hypothetical protein